MSHALDAWVKRHPFLEPIARLEATVRECARSLPTPEPSLADFEAHRLDFEAGLPLLHSPVAGPRLVAAAAGSFEALGPALLRAAVPEPLAGKVRALYDHLRDSGASLDRVLLAIATDGDEAARLPQLGAARYVAWHALAHALAPTIAAFAAWREGRPWPAGRCPTCGAKPLLSLLTKQAEGRQRSFVCGLCATHWQVPRIGCPHCGSEDVNRLALFELEDEPGLRLEVCELCKGYLKTWAGDERGAAFFSDWATLHLDAMAADRGYQRLGASLYET